jgi:hypothetical protein
MIKMTRKFIPRSKAKDVHARFREYFTEWMKTYPGVTEIPPPVMLALIRFAINCPRETIDLIKFTRRYKEASRAATLEDMTAAMDMLKVNEIIQS